MKKQIVILTILFILTNINTAFSLESYDYYINPIYQHLINQNQIRIERPIRSGLRSVTCNSYEEFKEAVKTRYNQRITQFKIQLKYDFVFSDVKNIVAQVHDEIMGEDDYLRFTFTSRKTTMNGYDSNVEVIFTMKYLTTAEQEQQVNDRVAEILNEIISQDMTYEEIEKAIHDWVVKNVQYDTSGQEHSAYAALFLGKTVCQGYALLMYKMLTEAGIETKIIDGTADDGSHAWNMVNICGNWFHVDATWNDPIPDQPDRVLYTYYNLNDSQIEGDHTWERSLFPLATTEYFEGEICANTFTIVGQIITDLPGYETGVKGAAIDLYGPDMSTTSDSDGNFTLAQVPEIEVDYLLKISAPNFRSYTQALSSVPARLDLGIIKLEIGVMAGTFSQEELDLAIMQAVEQKNYVISQKIAELDALVTENDSLSQTYLSLLADYSQLDTAHSEMTSLYSSLNQTYKALSNDYTQLNAQYSDIIDDYNVLSSENDDLNNWVTIFDIHNDRQIGIHEAINALKCATQMPQ
ncbi:MAG: transglutaminase-like protease [Candidatus Magnetoglobus multicellularis str. Araruama]|uniref:Transglutaminase-like protease n=1 Tax=Candidatus Magnetoglobus multicellularis str. Araruama TaxID=890399 RepID=A0A1V1PIQ5_9BACT|nr:MAG: transglutaminase-like protease [Candidatus Magnetoglobus multicellularis str. Araruama]